MHKVSKDANIVFYRYHFRYQTFKDANSSASSGNLYFISKDIGLGNNMLQLIYMSRRNIKEQNASKAWVCQAWVFSTIASNLARNKKTGEFFYSSFVAIIHFFIFPIIPSKVGDIKMSTRANNY